MSVLPMNALMNSEYSDFTEWHTANITSVWTCPTMYVLMNLQMTPLIKLFIAYIKGIQSQSCVWTYIQITLANKKIYDTCDRNMYAHGHYLLWRCWCLLRTPLSLKDLLHTSQEYGCFPLCMCWCVFRVSLPLNDLLQTSQEYGRYVDVSSNYPSDWMIYDTHHRNKDTRHYVYVAVSLVEPSDRVLHSSQEYGRSPLCIHWCTFIALLRWNDLWHTSQEYGCSTLFMSWCSFRVLWWKKKLKSIRTNLNRKKNGSESNVKWG
jgi:hypothetical protein